MTVSYQYDVASSTSGGFTRLLFKWKGSLYKLIYRELFLFCLAYGAMACVYRHVLTHEQKKKFDTIATYCNNYMNLIPLSFILGFYVSFVASRWWSQYMAIPWPDKIIHAIALHVNGYDEKSRMMRRTLALHQPQSGADIEVHLVTTEEEVPTLEHLVDAGFITTTELGIYKLVPNKEFNTYWVPCTWFTALLKDIKAQKRITDPMGVKHIMEEFNEFRQKCGLLWSYDWVSIPLVYTQEFLEFRSKCGLLWGYDWVSIPLVYTQVVTIATYAFFLAAIVGRQFLESSRFDFYVPFFTILQFFFYMGLLKVAEQLINPFGDDDEDFELNWIIDRHMKVSYLIVDTLLLRTPPLTKDIFYDDESPVLPYTEASAEFKKKTYRGSVANMVIPEEKQNLILPDILEEGEYEESKPTSIPSSVIPTPRASLNNLGGKESRSVSLSEEGGAGAGVGAGTGGTKCPTPPPGDQKGQQRGSSGATLSLLQQKTHNSSVSMALLAVGAHQGFLAADPEKVSQASQASGGSASPTRVICQPQFSDDDIGRIPGCVDSVALDLGDMEDDDSKEKTEKSRARSFRLPPSLKARVAVRKRPVITWRPYTRQPSMTQDTTISFPEGAIPQFPDDVKVDLPKDLTCPGCFEDECAFMWRTIEDDSDSLNTNSAVDDDPGDYLLYSPQYTNPHTPQPSHYTLHPFLNTPVSQNSSQCMLHQSQYIPPPTYTSAFSHYHDPHHSAPSSPSRPPRVLIEDFGPPWDPRSQPRFLVHRLGPRRARYKTKCRTRCIACSMPLLPIPRRATISRPSLSGLVRSLSESSVFTEAVKRLSEQQQLKSQGSKPSPQSPQLKRQQLSLPISSLSKPALNGRKGHRNSPSPETQ